MVSRLRSEGRSLYGRQLRRRPTQFRLDGRAGPDPRDDGAGAVSHMVRYKLWTLTGPTAVKEKIASTSQCVKDGDPVGTDGVENQVSAMHPGTDTVAARTAPRTESGSGAFDGNEVSQRIVHHLVDLHVGPAPGREKTIAQSHLELNL